MTSWMNPPLAALPFGMTNVQFAALVAIGALIYSVQRWRRNIIHKSRKGHPPSSPEPVIRPVEGTGALNVREVATEIQALLADVEETSRRVAAQMDNRRTMLEQLIADADQRIKLLEEATRAAAEQLARPSAPTPRLTEPQPAPTVTQRPIPSANPYQRPPTRPMPVPSSAPSALPRRQPPATAPAASPAMSSNDALTQSVHDLARSGLSARDIAAALHRQPGEIELILALYGEKRPTR